MLTDSDREAIERIREEWRTAWNRAPADKALGLEALDNMLALHFKAIGRAEAIAEAARDTERLSWLDRDDITMEFGCEDSGGTFVVISNSKGQVAAMGNIRAAIDAAMEWAD